MDATLEFLQALWALDHRLHAHSKKMKVRAGVTGPQRFVIRLLSLRKTMSPSDLARTLFFHKSTVSVILRSLEKDGLVRRRANPRDGRGAVLELTAKGARIAAQRSGTVEATVRAALKGLPARDVAASRRVLDRLAHVLA
jgi:DNA-binding MarR family transcriptional regulator